MDTLSSEELVAKLQRLRADMSWQRQPADATAHPAQMPPRGVITGHPTAEKFSALVADTAAAVQRVRASLLKGYQQAGLDASSMPHTTVAAPLQSRLPSAASPPTHRGSPTAGLKQHTAAGFTPPGDTAPVKEAVTVHRASSAGPIPAVQGVEVATMTSPLQISSQAHQAQAEVRHEGTSPQAEVRHEGTSPQQTFTQGIDRGMQTAEQKEPANPSPITRDAATSPAAHGVFLPKVADAQTQSAMGCNKEAPSLRECGTQVTTVTMTEEATPKPPPVLLDHAETQTAAVGQDAACGLETCSVADRTMQTSVDVRSVQVQAQPLQAAAEMATEEEQPPPHVGDSEGDEGEAVHRRHLWRSPEAARCASCGAGCAAFALASLEAGGESEGWTNSGTDTDTASDGGWTQAWRSLPTGASTPRASTPRASSHTTDQTSSVSSPAWDCTYKARDASAPTRRRKLHEIAARSQGEAFDR